MKTKQITFRGYYHESTTKNQVYLHHTAGNNNAEQVYQWWESTPVKVATCVVINDKGEIVKDPTALSALNANAKIWSPVRVQRWWLHSWAVEDGSYLRINNLTVGYTLPKQLSDRAKISSLRFFGTVNNLATLTGYSGYDPDVTARRSDPLTPGVDFAAYPRSRTWVVGLNLSF